MAFSDIPNIEDHKFYIDLAFKRSKKSSEELRERIKNKSNLEKSKIIELARLDVIKDTLAGKLNDILITFPKLDHLGEFYFEYLKTMFDISDVKQSIGAINWAVEKVNAFFFIYKKKINASRSISDMNNHRREFYGRVSSVVKQVKDNLTILRNAVFVLRELPQIKKMFTVSLFGFPNVGKTTLLTKLTKSKAEIASYPFTTRKINVGYSQINDTEVQVLDTPGTLNRFEKMNNIEKQAYLAVKFHTDCLVMVFDLSEEYPISKQEELFETIKKTFHKKILLFVTKTDILDKQTVSEFKKKYPSVLTTIEELKKSISSSLAQ